MVWQNWIRGGALSGQKEAGFLEVVDEVLGRDEVVLGDVLLVATAQDGAPPATRMVDLLGEVRIWPEPDCAGCGCRRQYLINGGDEGATDRHMGGRASYGGSSLFRVQEGDGRHGEADSLEGLLDVEGNHVRLPDLDPVCDSQLDDLPFSQSFGENTEHIDAEVGGEHSVPSGRHGHSDTPRAASEFEDPQPGQCLIGQDLEKIKD